jgi:hypothetical protein
MNIFVLALLTTALFLASESNAQTTVDVHQLDNGFLDVQAEATIPASLAVTWEVLTDYEHLSGFIPEMTSSHIISAAGETSLVEQKGGTSFLSFSFPIEVVFEIEAIPYRHISFHSIKGNLKDMTGSYSLEQLNSSVHLHYETKFHPDFWLPPFISTSIIRTEIEHQFDGLIKEIERREAINTGRSIGEAHQ